MYWGGWVTGGGNDSARVKALRPSSASSNEPAGLLALGVGGSEFSTKNPQSSDAPVCTLASVPKDSDRRRVPMPYDDDDDDGVVGRIAGGTNACVVSFNGETLSSPLPLSRDAVLFGDELASTPIRSLSVHQLDQKRMTIASGGDVRTSVQCRALF